MSRRAPVCSHRIHGKEAGVFQQSLHVGENVEALLAQQAASLVQSLPAVDLNGDLGDPVPVFGADAL